MFRRKSKHRLSREAAFQRSGYPERRREVVYLKKLPIAAASDDRRFGQPLFWLAAVLLCFKPAQAATYPAATCNVGDVQTQINAAADGDTVVIPNGSCSWTSGITTTKQITLMGASVPTRNSTATDGVTITHQAGAADLLTLSIGNSFHTTIANIRFMPGTGTGNYITVNGVGLPPLMHDMYFNIPNFQLVHAVQWFVTGGVIWNTTFDSTQNVTGACGTQIGSDSGSIVVKSNFSWDANSTMGTLDTNGDKNLYIEDSIFSYVGQDPDVDDNGRVVLRHDQFIDSGGGVTHGPTSATGGRQMEMYENTFTYPSLSKNINRAFWFRGGTAVITGNSIQAFSGQCYGSKATFTFIVESATRAQSHGCCTGYMCWHQPGSGANQVCNSSALSSSQTPADTCQVSDPIYIWNNTGTGATGYSAYVTTNDSDFSCNTGNTTTTFFQPNRDYFVDSGAKPGWTPYTYPHPLRSVASAPPTINLTTCNASEVQTALDSVSADGTTVVIPAGNCTWTNTVTYNQVYSTIIQGQTTCAGTPASSCTDNTIINAGTGTNALWNLNTVLGKSLRLTGLTFTGGDPNQSYGAVRISGTSQQLRIDHCHFNNVQQTALNIDGVYGVIDHIVAHVVSEFMRPLNSSWNGVGSWGDNAFAQPTGFGTDQFIFLEDSTITMTNPSNSGNGTNDCYRGGKFVVRHNVLNYSSVQGHATGHAGEDRGCRAAELYQNTFTLANDTGNFWQFNGFFLAGGPAMIWGNSLPTTGGNYYTHFITAHINREDNATYTQSATPNGWGYCGTAVNGAGSAWDQNSNTSTGYACLDQVGRGQGDLLSTGFPNRVNTLTGSISWPRQQLEPVYEWSNTWGCVGDQNCSFWVTYDPGIVQNRDYFLGFNNSSCPASPSGNCTAGVGVGTLANRPTSCTANSVSYPAGNSPGVGYWATDTNTLYVCSAPNFWTKYYSPYAYPHPLQGGGGGTSPSACDVNGDGATNVVDVQQEVNMALGITACTADINKDNACNIIDVQRVVNAALGGACVSP